MSDSMSTRDYSPMWTTFDFILKRSSPRNSAKPCWSKTWHSQGHSSARGLLACSNDAHRAAQARFSSELPGLLQRASCEVRLGSSNSGGWGDPKHPKTAVFKHSLGNTTDFFCCTRFETAVRHHVDTGGSNSSFHQDAKPEMEEGTEGTSKDLVLSSLGIHQSQDQLISHDGSMVLVYIYIYIIIYTYMLA